MQRLVIVAVILLSGFAATAQHIFKAKIINSESGEPLAGATVSVNSLKKSAIADTAGIAIINNLPAGKYIVKISSVGYEENETAIEIPMTVDIITIVMKAEHEEEEEIVIQSTRSSRTISDIPTRVEFVAGEELDEKANMKPGDIRMVLNETTGITTQQTSEGSKA